MATRKRVKHVKAIVDILVVDREDRPILIADVQTNAEEARTGLARMTDFLDLADLAVPFVMLVDLERISIYRGDEGLQDEPIFSSSTRPILGYYSEYYRESKPGRVGKDLLRGLVLGWLRDVSYRWKSKSTSPPAYDQLDRLGLVRLFENAIFESEVPFGGHRLYRDESLDRPDPWTGA